MIEKQPLVLKSVDLPLHMVLVGEDGEEKDYVIKSAGRKFGASLSTPEMPKRK